MSDFEGHEHTHQTVVTAVNDPVQVPKVHTQACLVVIYGKDLGKRILLRRQGAVTIGRSSANDIQIDQESVSRNHCRLVCDGELYRIIDNQSTNGTYINDELIDDSTLNDGDQVKIGQTLLKFIRSGNIETQYHEEIYKLMTTDGLTQVANKRYFDEILDKEIDRSMRYERFFSLMILDIDHFKEINDTYGHLAGDSVLRQLGHLIQERVRRHDIAARTGGEEFAILLPEIDEQGAVILAEDLRQLISKTSFPFEGTSINITVSIGIAQMTSENRNRDAIVQAADQKLYEAKNSGRNRVCH